MDTIDLQAYMLYWGMIGALVGASVTPLVYDRRHRNPWTGALIGLFVGVVSAEAFGWLTLRLLLERWSGAALLSLLGCLVLLIPLWWSVPERSRKGFQQRGFVSSSISPLMFYLLTMSIFPFLWAIILAFFDYSPRRVGGPILGLGEDNPFVGLAHFQEMWVGHTRNARMFQNSMNNTLLFAMIILPLNLAITLPLAALIESVHERLKPLFRAVYFLPVVTSSVGVAVMWGYIFHAQYGLLNQALKAFGMTPIAWLQDPRVEILGIPAAMFAVIVAYLWQDFGYNLIIFIAALQNIPISLKDAARVDGASPAQVFLHVTLPLLRPTIMVTSVLTMISSFQVFDIIQVMTNGGPGRIGKTDVVVLEIYKNAFRYERMGWAAAMALVLFVLVLLVTTAQRWLLRTTWEY